MTKMLSEHPEVTAIVATNDLMALGAIKAAIACGRRVPEDISVIGIDNIDSSAVSKPSLTTLDQSGNRYGAKIFEILHNDIVAGTSGKYIVPMRLIKRESTARLRKTPKTGYCCKNETAGPIRRKSTRNRVLFFQVRFCT